VLDTHRFEHATRRAMPDWRDALDRFLVEIRAESALPISQGAP
jgi:hypothetical protein